MHFHWIQLIEIIYSAARRPGIYLELVLHPLRLRVERLRRIVDVRHETLLMHDRRVLDLLQHRLDGRRHRHVPDLAVQSDGHWLERRAGA